MCSTVTNVVETILHGNNIKTKTLTWKKQAIQSSYLSIIMELYNHFFQCENDGSIGDSATSCEQTIVTLQDGVI